MDVSTKSKVVAELLATHRIITRGLRITLVKSKAMAQEGHSLPAQQKGFLCYVATLSTVLQSHLSGEEEVAYPCFREKLPDFPEDLLLDQHRKLMAPLEEIKQQIAELMTDPGASRGYSQLHFSLCKLAELWLFHTQIEEEFLALQKVDFLNPDEENMLSTLFVKHLRTHAKPEYLVAPFLLYNLPSSERAILSEALPSHVTQELIPVIWKSHWAPMLPYLYAQ